MRSSSLILTLALPLALPAQGHKQLTTADYDRAVKMLGQNVNALVVGGQVNPTWTPDGKFYYRATRPDGVSWILVDPAKKKAAPLFDHAKLAAAVNTASGGSYKADALPFMTADLSPKRDTLSFSTAGKRYACDLKAYACKQLGDAAATGMPGMMGRRGPRTLEVTSPDGKKAAFIRDWNLYVRDVATNAVTQLTTDGTPNFGYATDNAGWVHSARAVLKWSPDSKKIATQQQDDRKLSDFHMVRYQVGAPKLESWKYPFPGDSVVSMIHRVVIDVESKTVTRLKMAPDFHRAMLGDDISMDDLQWKDDGSMLAIASTPRDHKGVTLRVANTATGEVRDVLKETVSTQFESITGYRVLWNSNEIIWNSQRDDWSQLYLYDLTTGQLKNAITTGEGPVSEIVSIDEKARTITYLAQGRVAGQDPYLAHAFRTTLDGKGPAVLLTPDVGTHTIRLSPDNKYLVDTYSTADTPPVSALRDAKGKLVMELEKADISKLVAAGWKPPILFSVKAADGKTDIYGQLFRPTNFDSTKKYPIINNAYPGPQSGSVGSRAFSAARGDKQALAELGFIVVSIDGRGSGPGRSKSFHDYYYGRMGRGNTLEDQVAGMQNLAKRYAWIDIDKAAMWGHSGGGFITADAMFRYPDFFKVGISESGNHDQRNYEDDWGERYQGLLVRNGSDDNYAAEANQLQAKNLKGKLLLAHGTADDNVPVDNTMLVVDALIKANKDFDLLLIPNAAHGYGAAGNYMMRRRWDYFVTHLMGAIPPKEYIIK
ncbi:MAG TPA: DPP IV N-terminal domain-containing protein [Gemmatimonadaceae bacterium]|jgi:dipeptidyl aminopeptidase/acylaminoacyl peptidase